MTQSDALDRINAAAEIVYSVMAPTPQYAWPLLSARAGADIAKPSRKARSRTMARMALLRGRYP